MSEGSSAGVVGESDGLTGKSGSGVLVAGMIPHAASSSTQITRGIRYLIVSPFHSRKTIQKGNLFLIHKKRRVCGLVSSVIPGMVFEASMVQ